MAYVYKSETWAKNKEARHWPDCQIGADRDEDGTMDGIEGCGRA